MRDESWGSLAIVRLEAPWEFVIGDLRFSHTGSLGRRVGGVPASLDRRLGVSLHRGAWARGGVSLFLH